LVQSKEEPKWVCNSLQLQVVPSQSVFAQCGTNHLLCSFYEDVVCRFWFGWM